MPRPRQPAQAMLQIVEGSPDACFTVDSEWRIVYANAVALRFASRPQSEVQGSSLWTLFPESPPGPLQSECRRAMEERVVVRTEGFHAAGNCWLEVCAYPVEDGLALRLRDISLRVKAESTAREASEMAVLLQKQVEESRALAKQLEAANQALLSANDGLVSLSVAADTARERAERAVRERDHVIAMVAHDLKNPLHTIGLTLTVLREVALSEPDRQRKLGIIEATINRMDRLIAGLLDMRRIEAGQALSVAPEPVEVPMLLREACGVFRPQIEDKGVSLTYEVPEPCPR